MKCAYETHCNISIAIYSVSSPDLSIVRYGKCFVFYVRAVKTKKNKNTKKKKNEIENEKKYLQSFYSDQVNT